MDRFYCLLLFQASSQLKFSVCINFELLLFLDHHHCQSIKILSLEFISLFSCLFVAYTHFEMSKKNENFNSLNDESLNDKGFLQFVWLVS